MIISINSNRIRSRTRRHLSGSSQGQGHCLFSEVPGYWCSRQHRLWVRPLRWWFYKKKLVFCVWVYIISTKIRRNFYFYLSNIFIYTTAMYAQGWESGMTAYQYRLYKQCKSKQCLHLWYKWHFVYYMTVINILENSEDTLTSIIIKINVKLVFYTAFA